MKKIRNSVASLVPVLPINRDQCPLPPSLRAWPRGASSVPVRGPTGTSFSPESLVPVAEPGLKAPTNRDYMGVCPPVLQPQNLKNRCRNINDKEQVML